MGRDAARKGANPRARADGEKHIAKAAQGAISQRGQWHVLYR